MSLKACRNHADQGSRRSSLAYAGSRKAGVDSAATGGQQPTQRGTSASGSRVHKLEELTWPQIDAFDRQRTLFILPMGMIEQHGPHLPVGADTIAVTYEASAGQPAGTIPPAPTN
jgi:hypothetical protein